MRRFTVKPLKLVRRVRFTHDGERLALAWNSTRHIRFVRIDTGEVEHFRPETEEASPLFEFSNDGHWLAVGNNDGVCRVYKDLAPTPLAEHRAGTGSAVWRSIRGVAFTSANGIGHWLATVGAEFWLWNPVTQQYLVAPEQDEFQSVAFAPSGQCVYVARLQAVSRYSIRPFAEMWRVDHGVRRLFSHHYMLPTPDGRSVVVVDWREVRILAAEDGQVVSRFQLSSDDAREIAFIPGTRLLAVAGGAPTNLRVYDTDTGRLAREYDWGIGGIHSVTFSNDGAMGAAGGDKGRVVVWDLD